MCYRKDQISWLLLKNIWEFGPLCSSNSFWKKNQVKLLPKKINKSLVILSNSVINISLKLFSTPPAIFDIPAYMSQQGILSSFSTWGVKYCLLYIMSDRFLVLLRMQIKNCPKMLLFSKHTNVQVNPFAIPGSKVSMKL